VGGLTLRSQARLARRLADHVEDVIWSFDYTQGQRLAELRELLCRCAEGGKDRRPQVLFSFRGNVNRELPLIMSSLPILPSNGGPEKISEKTSLEPALGSGAYKVDTVDIGRSITYRRVPDWWAKDLWMNRGRNNFETIPLRLLSRQQHRLRGLQGGRPRHPPRGIRAATGRRATTTFRPVKAGRIARVELAHENATPMQGFIFNLRRDMFKDRRVREAISLMYDFEWQNKNLSYGFYSRTRSFFGNCELEAKGLPSPEELKILEPLRGKIPDEVFTTEYNPPRPTALATSGNRRARRSRS